ncbi:MAG: hypothetical protein ACRD4K_13395, partial [Candidatus Acidiferrales bacterium]
AEGNVAQALQSVQAFAHAEASMPFEFGPPFIDKPSYELLGDLLLQAGNPAQARDAYRLALQRAPERTASLAGLAQAETAAGNAAAGRELVAHLHQIWHDADRDPRARPEPRSRIPAHAFGRLNPHGGTFAGASRSRNSRVTPSGSGCATENIRQGSCVPNRAAARIIGAQPCPTLHGN